MSETNFKSADFETTRVGYFDKGGKKGYQGHPRRATATLLTQSDGKIARVVAPLSAFAVSSGDLLIFHNASFDLQIGFANGVFSWDTLRGVEIHCTRTMAKLLYSDESARLKDLAKAKLDAKDVVTFEEASQATPEAFEEYAKRDSLFTAQLFPLLKKELEQAGMWELYLHEMAFLLVNLHCQLRGFLVDLNRLTAVEAEAKAALESILAGIPGNKINWNSPKQLKQKLYGELNLPLVYQNGKVSTGKKALKKLSRFLVVRKLLEAKKQEAILRGVKQYRPFVDAETNRIYPYIDTLGTETGRCSSSFPNMQNVGKTSPVKEVFVAGAGAVLIVLDYSQIEPRVLAHLLNPSSFSLLFLDGSNCDFYARIAESSLSIRPGEIPSREVAKQIILAVFYGMTDGTVADTLGISLVEARQLLDGFHKAYPEIGRLRDGLIQEARRTGFAIGPLGRRRQIANLHATDEFDRAAAERKVLNAVVQGGAATLFKIKLAQLRRELPAQAHLLHHVHDECVIEAPTKCAHEIFLLAKRVLEAPEPWFGIPLQVEGGMGRSWLEAKTNKIV